MAEELTPFERGVLVGILIGEGAFGGDGRQPQITLRMHVRHEALFRWLMGRFPRTGPYGAYEQRERRYSQWMAGGRALVEDVLPVLDGALGDEIDGHAAARYAAMQ